MVFNAPGEGGSDLFSLDLKSRKVSRIAATPDYEGDPAVSPDGGSVVYAAGAPGTFADPIFLRSIDGKVVKRLTGENADDAAPAFSPDGSLVVFTRGKTFLKGGGKAASGWTDEVICVMKADGSGLREITDKAPYASSPHFTADGKSIVFAGMLGIYAVPVDGSAAPKLTIADDGMRRGALSPDGRSIAFSRGTYAPDHAITVAHADGGNPRRLTHGPKQGCFDPAFTPDGKRLLFLLETYPGGHPTRGLWEVDVAGGEPREVADSRLFDDPLHWAPKPPADKRP